MTQLIITEKPSVAKDIAKVLKVSSQKQGYFEGNGYRITWALGHLVQLVNPEDYGDQFKQWSLDTLPIVPTEFRTALIDNKGSQNQYHVIETLLNQDDVDHVICATDAGREGELIFRLIYEKAQCQKPISRLWISSQTDEAIKEGFDNLKSGDAYVPLFHSAISRTQADWLIGMNATRAYTIKCSRGAGVMSVGRVQTPVLKMIVDRYKAHTGFKSQTFYEIYMDVQHPNGIYRAKWFKDKDDRFWEEAIAQAVLEDVQCHLQGHIEKLTQKEKKEKQPLLYDLTELQRDANKRYQYSADQTLKIMQELYEKHKILTYPRTSSRYLSQDMVPKLSGLLSNLQELEPYSDWAKDVLAQPLNVTKRLVDDAKVTDHHAIIPTTQKADLSRLNEQERHIFDLVIKRFLAAFYPECSKHHTEIISMFGAHTFRSSGTIITDPGWRKVYGVTEVDESAPTQKSKRKKKESDGDQQTEEDSNVLLPEVKAKDDISQQKVTLSTGKTKAPPLFNEASLLGAMETAGKDIEDEDIRYAMKECGLGTPATRAQILERLITVGYVIREKNKLTPTPKGELLIASIQDEQLVSPELTGQWEKKLNTMAQNQYERERFMQEIQEFTEQIVENVKDAEVVTIHPDQVIIGNCPLCDGSVIDRKLSYSCSNWKARGCEFAIWKSMAGKTISEAQAKLLIKEGKTKVIKGFKSKAGNVFDAALKLDNGKVTFAFDSDRKVIGKCPVCQGDVVETPKAYSCSNWKTQNCKFAVWKEMAQLSISSTVVGKLLKEGKTDVLTGFKSQRTGNSFDAALTVKEGRVVFEFSN